MEAVFSFVKVYKLSICQVTVALSFARVHNSSLCLLPRVSYFKCVRAMLLEVICSMMPFRINVRCFRDTLELSASIIVLNRHLLQYGSALLVRTFLGDVHCLLVRLLYFD